MELQGVGQEKYGNVERGGKESVGLQGIGQGECGDIEHGAAGLGHGIGDRETK